VDRVVFLLGRACVEDFFEILVLAANGYGFGGLKVLRSLYEKAVVARFLDSHPDLVQDFADYFNVTQGKLMRSLESVLGQEAFDRNDREAVENRYRAVKERFKNEECKECGHARYRTWVAEDLVTMASQFTILKRLLPTAYYIPMGHTHASMVTLAERLEIKNGLLEFSITARRDKADHALTFGHAVLMDVLDLQVSRFRVEGLAEAVKVCEKDFDDIWNPGG
jgi:hypothetical protein